MELLISEAYVGAGLPTSVKILFDPFFLCISACRTIRLLLLWGAVRVFVGPESSFRGPMLPVCDMKKILPLL